MGRFTAYLEAIARANGLGQGVEWLFYPGMLLDSREKWWDDFGLRHAAHEGIDICFFRTGHRKISHLKKTALIPAMDKGVVMNRVDDFLGQTLVVAHGGIAGLSQKVIFIYSHLEIEKNLVPGCRVEKGQIIAQVFDTGLKGSKLLPHLHFSCFELMEMPLWSSLDWHLFSNQEKLIPINPVFI